MNKVPVIRAETDLSGGEPLALVVAFSARALVHAVVRSGFSVISLDSFGDQDLLEIARQCHVLSEWGGSASAMSVQPDRWGFYSAGEKTPASGVSVPVFLGGGCENWPHLLRQLENHPDVHLLGPRAEQMRSIRNLELWGRAAQSAGLGFPTTVQSADGLLRTGRHSPGRRWLSKSLDSGGGAAVVAVAESSIGGQLSTLPGVGYWQEEIAGRVLGVTCIAHPTDGRPAGEGNTCMAVDLLGATESWQAPDWPGPSEFAYRGSWGPIALTPDQQARIKLVAGYIANRTGLIGWLQLDLIEDCQGQLWLLEVNPRWTAGMEVLLRSGSTNPVDHHWSAWQRRDHPPITTQPPRRQVAKAIVYADRDYPITQCIQQRLALLPRDTFADIPAPRTVGTTITTGQPVLTILATAPPSQTTVHQRGQLLDQLHQRREMVTRILAADPC